MAIETEIGRKLRSEDKFVFCLLVRAEDKLKTEFFPFARQLKLGGKLKSRVRYFLFFYCGLIEWPDLDLSPQLGQT